METHRTRQAIKALTSQIKDIALKASGAYKNYKLSSGSSNHNRNYADSDADSDSARFRCPYRRPESSDLTPRIWGKEMESRLKGLSSGEGTPTSVSGHAKSIVFMEEDEPKEWVAQVEPSVLITFVSLTEEEKKAAKVRAAAIKASGKKKESGKSSVLLDIKLWDDETDMKKLEEAVRSIKMEGLFWGASKLVPVGYGIKKLQIMMTIVDDLVSVDTLIEEILTVESINEHVQSCDIVAFKKI